MQNEFRIIRNQAAGRWFVADGLPDVGKYRAEGFGRGHLWRSTARQPEPKLKGEKNGDCPEALFVV